MDKSSKMELYKKKLLINNNREENIMSQTIGLKTRSEIAPEFKWKIEKVYANTEVWDQDFQQIKDKAPKLKDFQGKLANLIDLKAYLKLEEELYGEG